MNLFGKKKIKNEKKEPKIEKEKVEVKYRFSDVKNIHHVNSEILQEFFNSFEPTFILNTGRSGSAFFSEVFSKFNFIENQHEAFPSLMMLSNFAFHNQNENEILRNIFHAARLERLLDSFLKDKLYVESNHCLVFYANQIKELFPRAKFIHVIRDPEKFVVSAVRKGWHLNDSIWENNRIRGLDNTYWSSLSQLEKNAWVWSKTHKYIEELKVNFPDIYTCKLENLTTQVQEFRDFLNFVSPALQMDDNEIIAFQRRKINEVEITKNEPDTMRKNMSFGGFESWGVKEQDSFLKITEELRLKYNY